MQNFVIYDAHNKCLYLLEWIFAINLKNKFINTIKIIPFVP